MEDKKYYDKNEDWEDDEREENVPRYSNKLPEDYSPELDDWWIPLRDMFNRLPKNIVLMIEPKRFGEAAKSIDIIKSAIDDDIEDVKYETSFDDLLGTTLEFTIHTKYSLGIRDTETFAKALKYVDVIGISANLEEEIDISFSYQGVRIPMPPIVND